MKLLTWLDNSTERLARAGRVRPSQASNWSLFLRGFVTPVVLLPVLAVWLLTRSGWWAVAGGVAALLIATALVVVFGRLLWRYASARRARGATAGATGDESEDLTQAERAENRWALHGWVQMWVPTTANPAGRRRRYWGRPGEHGLIRLYPGIGAPPPDPSEPHFYVNDRRVYRDVGHPEGASSVPYFVITAGRVYPSEGYPSGPSERKLYDIRRIRRRGVATTVRPNPRKSWHP